MGPRLAAAARVLLQAAIAVCMPGGVVIILAYHFRRWRKTRANAEASTHAP